MTLNLTILKKDFAICKLNPNTEFPKWIFKSSLYSVLKSSEELSILCEDKYIPDNIHKNGIYKAMNGSGPVGFPLTRFTSVFRTLLEKKGISILLIALIIFFLSDLFTLENMLWII